METTSRPRIMHVYVGLHVRDDGVAHAARTEEHRQVDDERKEEMTFKKNHGSRRGVTVGECLICVTAMAAILGLALGLNVGCSDVVYPHNVTGRVVQVDARFAGMGNGTEQKFAMRLDAVRADQTVKRTAASVDGAVDVECLSTRCALVRPGSCVELECNREVRWWEPNVIQCKLVKERSCAPASVGSSTRD